jgi:hypothetical protein
MAVLYYALPMKPLDGARAKRVARLPAQG